MSDELRSLFDRETPDGWKRRSANRAKRLARLIELNAPERIIGREWSMLWDSMTKGYGPELFERGQADIDEGRLDDEEFTN